MSKFNTRANSIPATSVRQKRARTPMTASGLKSRTRRGNDSIFGTRIQTQDKSNAKQGQRQNPQ